MAPLTYTTLDIPDVIYPSDNKLMIPTLDINMQATEAALPFVAWGSVKRKDLRLTGTLHFYVDDARFSNLYNDCTPVLNSGVPIAVEPNYSLFNQTVIPAAIWWIYQKRWLARFWQSRGIRTIVDLNVAERYSELNLYGVPQGWRAYATRGHTDRLDALQFEYSLAKRRAGAEPLFVVVGGGKAVAELCMGRNWIHVPDHIQSIAAK